MSDAVTPHAGHPRGVSVPITKAIEAMLAAKAAANYRPRYIKSLRLYLGKFAKGREDLPLSEVTVETIERWFAERSEVPSSQRSNFGRLCTLFSFAERRQWIVKSPMKMMERIRVDPKPPKILSVHEAQKLMDFAAHHHPRSLAFLALALFAGVRPEELRKVAWENVGKNLVTIDAAASKVRRRRIVHLRENAVEWLDFARKMGAILPITINAHVSILRRAAVHLGFEDGWPQDCLRHSSASYWLADTKDAAAVARELGNSPAILLTHYYEIVTAEQASEFWSIRPNWLLAVERSWNAGKGGELSLHERQAVSLYSEGFSDTRAALKLGLNPATVKRIRREAICRLLAMLTRRALAHKEKQDALLNFVLNHEPTTQAALAKQTGISEPAVCYSLKFLRAKMAVTAIE